MCVHVCDFIFFFFKARNVRQRLHRSDFKPEILPLRLVELPQEAFFLSFNRRGFSSLLVENVRMTLLLLRGFASLLAALTVRVKG